MKTVHPMYAQKRPTLPTSELSPIQKARRIIRLYKAQAKLNRKMGQIMIQQERIREELAKLS